MKDILGTLLAALLVMMSLITLLTAEHNWEPSNEPSSATPRVSDLRLRLALKSHHIEPLRSLRRTALAASTREGRERLRKWHCLL